MSNSDKHAYTASTDEHDVWGWAERLSERVHLTDELRRARQQRHNTLNTCGSCAKWMTRGCPREQHDNRSGRSHGPSCGALKCGEFVMSASNAKSAALGEEKIAELEKRLQAAEKGGA